MKQYFSIDRIKQGLLSLELQIAAASLFVMFSMLCLSEVSPYWWSSDDEFFQFVFTGLIGITWLLREIKRWPQDKSE